MVEGILPIFGECVDMDVRRNQVRKISILDYAQIIDLHLKKQDLIIRILRSPLPLSSGDCFFPPPTKSGKTDHQSGQLESFRFLPKTTTSSSSSVVRFSTFCRNHRRFLRITAHGRSSFRLIPH
ncbi:MAG UNVERIFIED_CONTAM: hypothetical protein LVR29_07980 [Microcystis novacekii LVE1205-3]